MKNYPQVRDAIRTSYNVNARPRLMVEWNMNRISTPTAANTPNEGEAGYDTEFFPIDSIVEPNRPTKGILKARVNEAIVAGSDPNKQDVRFYLAAVDDAYKYWTSPVPTDAAGNFPTFTAAFATANDIINDSPDSLTVVRPSVTYAAPVKVNKIVIKTENTFASLKTWTILTKATTGGAWVSVSSNAGMDTKTGQITLWWNGSAWTATRPTGTLTSTTIAGVQLRVSALQGGYDLNGNPTTFYSSGSTQTTSGASSYFNLIEIAACLEADLSTKLMNVNDTFDFGEKSLVYPMGTITANVATVTLSDLYNDAEYGLGTSTVDKPGLFSNDNAQSPFRGLAVQNAIFNLEYIYTVSGVDYPVQQFKMYAGPWETSSESAVSVPLRDYSKFFDEQKPQSAFWMDRTATEIIWRVCDLLGFVDYQTGIDDTENSPTISFFWTDGEKTAWEIFNEISVATQTAIYFDAWGRLQVRSRRHMFDQTASPAWTLRVKNSGTELADIISSSVTGQAQTNHVTVKYYTSDLTPWNNGVPKMERVWQPEGTVTLRGEVLRTSVTSGSEWLRINPTNAEHWQYEGIVQVEGEIIRYAGKEYTYHTASGPTTVVLMNADDLKKYANLSGPQYVRKNSLTGRLKIAERGVWNTPIKDHLVDTSKYSVRRLKDGTRTVGVKGLTHNANTSVVKLSGGEKFKVGDMMIATRGSETDSGWYHMGTRLRFKGNGRDHQRAGLVFNNNGTNENGYFVELQLSSKVNKDRNELIFYSRPETQPGEKRFGGAKGKGFQVSPDRWYDIDVRINPQGNNHFVQVAVGGKWVMDFKIDGAGEKNPMNGKFGIFTRGDTEAEFEYLYGVSTDPGIPLDDTSWWDYVEGGYTGRQWETEWVYEPWKGSSGRKKKPNEKKRRYRNKRFMDDFGPWIHEIREFDVKFDPAPVYYSRPMLTSREAIMTDYNASAFGAKFVVANTARRNVIINGGDTLSTNNRSTQEINNVCIIHGRTIEAQDAQQVVVKNDAQIRAEGKIETEVDSQWIQSEATATALGDWINEHWSEGADEVEAVIFGNPLIEIGDVVAIERDDQFMTAATHMYFVVGVSNDFNNGIETSLSLRRVT